MSLHALSSRQVGFVGRLPSSVTAHDGPSSRVTSYRRPFTHPLRVVIYFFYIFFSSRNPSRRKTIITRTRKNPLFFRAAATRSRIQTFCTTKAYTPRSDSDGAFCVSSALTILSFLSRLDSDVLMICVLFFYNYD